MKQFLHQDIFELFPVHFCIWYKFMNISQILTHSPTGGYFVSKFGHDLISSFAHISYYAYAKHFLYMHPRSEHVII